MKYFMLALIGVFFVTGCQGPGNTMVLLDEKVKVMNVSESNGFGDMNQNILFSFNDQQSIKVFEKAIRTAVQSQTTIDETKPDYDVMVEYVGGFPTHAIHLWLGEENEKSTFMYMIGEGETYVTSAKTTNQLRELLLREE
ncbi:hypothetical protein [Niallia sp. Krafla_26]|uniref:hypothetical protein n=1 Tax=Niallia sp. Krafla_26 TaxID=3064703 RepID=UPI003D168B54